MCNKNYRRRRWRDVFTIPNKKNRWKDFALCITFRHRLWKLPTASWENWFSVGRDPFDLHVTLKLSFFDFCPWTLPKPIRKSICTELPSAAAKWLLLREVVGAREEIGFVTSMLSLTFSLRVGKLFPLLSSSPSDVHVEHNNFPD